MKIIQLTRMIENILFLWKNTAITLTKLDKELMALHFQLKHLPHSKMSRLVEHGYLDNKF